MVEIDFEMIEAPEAPYIANFLGFYEKNLIEEIKKLASEYPKKKALNINFGLLEQYDSKLSDTLLEEPDVLIEAAKLAAQNIQIPTVQNLDEFDPQVHIFNLPDNKKPLMKNIGCNYIGKMIPVEGIVIDVRAPGSRLKIGYWQCRRCGNVYKLAQEGQTINQPTICECKHKDFLLIEEQSKFIDYQEITVRGPPEQISHGEKSTNLEVHLNGDMVNTVRKGEHIKASGIIRLSKPKKGIVFNKYLDALHVEKTINAVGNKKIYESLK